MAINNISVSQELIVTQSVDILEEFLLTENGGEMCKYIEN